MSKKVNNCRQVINIATQVGLFVPIAMSTLTRLTIWNKTNCWRTTKMFIPCLEIYVDQMTATWRTVKTRRSHQIHIHTHRRRPSRDAAFSRNRQRTFCERGCFRTCQWVTLFS